MPSFAEPTDPTEGREGQVDSVSAKQRPHRVTLPGFIADEEIGLGSVIQKTTSYLGIRTCSGCQRRAGALNQWLVFTNRR